MTFLSKLQLADWISLAGLVPVWLALTAILAGRPLTAILLTLLSFSIDMADGWVARRRQQTSRLGLQLDSTIDTLNYPIFCALFSYVFLTDQSWLGGVVAICILVFSALRLTRMASDGIKKESTGKSYYEGLVTPHLLLLVILLYYWHLFIDYLPIWISALAIILVSIGMISSIRTYKPRSLSLMLLGVIVLASIALYSLAQSSFSL